ncbi:MAG: serine/threonine-protein phosphatase [Candidatus Omnitrophica bacterium]|nr:serine/threonine-protein phosphatase [Candidatus Omnitrophota bacterium]MCF7893439.1 serine/threonine-protein phosphatase [Candidatus Omnitrophota bacterium]
MSLINAEKKIPAKYLSEFIFRRTSLIKKRLKLLCLSTIILYSCITIISAIVVPEEFQLIELSVWIMLLLVSALTIYLSRKVNKLIIAKLTAYFFIVFLLGVVTAISIIYYQYVDTAASLYLLVLFLVSFIIPWRSLEIVYLSFFHFISYAYLGFYLKSYFSEAIELRTYWYFDGFLLLSIGFIVCFIIRNRENRREVENFVLFKEVEEKNDQMKNELELATRVHTRLVPHSIDTKRCQIAATYLPAYYMGGDYGRFSFPSQDKLTFIICDVTGHGVSAALLVNSLHIEFERLAKESKDPGIILKELDSFIRSDFSQTNMYLSAFCGQLNYKDMHFSYSSYGHPPQYIYKRVSADLKRINSQTGWLGLPAEQTTIYQDQMSFDSGDQIVLFTDGVVEAKNDVNQLYGSKRLEYFLEKNKDLTPNLFNQQLLNELNLFTKNNIKDDIFIINILIK